jgi:hypothetical protein
MSHEPRLGVRGAHGRGGVREWDRLRWLTATWLGDQTWESE